MYRKCVIQSTHVDMSPPLDWPELGDAWVSGPDLGPTLIAPGHGEWIVSREAQAAQTRPGARKLAIFGQGSK